MGTVPLPLVACRPTPNDPRLGQTITREEDEQSLSQLGLQTRITKILTYMYAAPVHRYVHVPQGS